MRKFTKVTMLLMMLIAASAMTFAQSIQRGPDISDQEWEWIQSQQPEKGPIGTYDPSDYPPPTRQGGDDIASATVISSLPYTDNGTTTGYNDDYDVGPSTNTAPDVVYSFTPGSDMILDAVSLCGSSYDTKIAVYEDNISNEIAYNDDACGLQSEVGAIPITTGHTYYIIVDGYGSSNGSYTLNVTEFIPPPGPDPITSFPYLADYEAGDFPNTQSYTVNAESDVYVQADPTGASAYNARLEGDSYSGWSGGSTSTTYDQAFNVNTDHISSIDMMVEPTGQPGILTLKFDHQQFLQYSYPNYVWLRVLVDGAVIPDVNGEIAFNRAGVPDDEWFVREYDLSAYQGADFDLTIQSSCKYYYTANYVDNVEIYYLTQGDVNGYVFNYDGLPINDALVETEDGLSTRTTPDGFYELLGLQSGPMEMTASKPGYNVITDMVTIPVFDVVRHDFTLTQPNFVVNPLQLDVTVNPDEYYETPLGILNNGSGPLGWEASIAYLTDRETAGISNVKATSSNVAETHNGNASQAENTRDMFDLQFSFDADGPSGLTGLAGSETDGNFIYVTKWADNQIVKFNMDGTFVEIFTISGVSGLRDLAYDGEYFYGGAASTTIYEMDFENQTLVSSISSPTAVRAIAYDSDNDAFWVNNWDSDLTLVGRDGSQITTIASPPSIYGMAYDNYLDGGPYLWVFSGTTTGGGCQVEQMEIASGNLTGLSHSVSGDLGGLIAGGLWIQPGIVPGYVTLGGLGQGTPDMVFGYELTEGGGGASGNWLSLDNYDGTVPPFGGVYNVGVNFDASGMEEGEVHTAEIMFTSTPNVGTITVPVTMTVIGDPLTPPSDLTAEITNMVTGNVALSWTGVPSAPNFQHYLIKRDGQTIAVTTNTSYTQTLPDYDEYCYAVYAVYDEGNSAPAGPECVNWLLPEITVDPMMLSAEVFEGEMVEVLGLTVTNTGMSGSMLSYSTDIDPAAGFLESAAPANGILQAGETAEIRLIYSADGYTAGVYTQGLDITSNDINSPTVTVSNEMTVIEAAAFDGQVTDGNTGMPLQGVTVTAGMFSAETNDIGEYYLVVEEGTYDLNFSKEGYQDVDVLGQFAAEGDVTTVDVEMFESANPPQFVTATVNDDDTECLVEWGLPAGPYLVVYDDGTAENMFAWNQPGNVNAVKFTPAGYPAVVTGGEIYIGDGFFPQGGEILGTSFGVAVYDDDGTNGMPGTVIDSVAVDVTNLGWVTVSGLSAAITEGDFYLGMIQGGYAPNTAGVGIDESLPVAYRSYQKPNGADWMVSSYQDFMIRAIVDGPQGTLTDAVSEMIVPNYKVDFKLDATTLNDRTSIPAGKELAPEYKPYTGEMDMRGVEMYTLSRHANFDPNDPNDLGTATLLDDDLMVNEYNDAAFAGLDMGYYKYSVTAIFTNGDESEPAISNVVGHLLRYDVTINVSTTDGESAEGAVVSLLRINNTFGEDYFEIVPEAETLVLEDVWRGEYSFKVYLPGYHSYILPTVYILDDMTIDVVLQEGRWPVNNLWVDPLTSIAYWNAPTPGQVFFEDFEGEEFPPEGWMMETEGEGWFRSDNAGTGAWAIPPGDGFYAVTNDDAAPSGNNACCDYLMTPSVALDLYPDYLLVFDSYFDGAFGGSAYVDYSVDGTSWSRLHDMDATAGWTETALDLADWSGANAGADFWLRFHYDDNGAWADGWAIDNVTVASASSMIFRDTDELMGYEVYLDGTYKATTGETTYQYVGLTYGQTYEAAVAAMYSSGPSEKMYYTFTSLYLIPPDSLVGEQSDNAAYLTWAPPLTPSTRAESMIPSEMIDNDPVSGTKNHSVKEAPYGASQAGEPVSYNFLSDHSGYFSDVSGGILVEMDMATYTSTEIGTTASSLASGDFLPGNETTMYGAGDWGENLYSIDVATGTATLISSIGYPSDMSISGMACDKSTGTMYVSGTNISQSFIGTIDLATGDVTQIGASTTTAPGLIDIAIDASGQMYGWCIVTDQSFMIDKETGDFTVLGSLGFDANYGQGGNYDPEDDIVYLAAYNLTSGGPELRILDRTTGGTSLATTFSYAQVGLFGVPGGGGTGPGPGGDVPENLIGYNVYRDMWEEGDDPIAYVEYVEDEQAEYYDLNLEPGTYEYAVTAVYDLTPYGFPGETDESMIEGPVEVVITYGYDLPFVEEWTAGTFGSQQWMSGCDNWWVNGGAGNPAPAAEFTWDDPLTEYECELIGYPLKGSVYEEGGIFLDFDLKLDDRNMTGEEHFMVRVWENGEWHDVWQMSNNGDIDWTTYHLDITDEALGNDFRIGFFAAGMNSTDIYSWFVDNINVYFECPAPFELTADATEEPFVYLNWQSPDTVGPVSEWLHYDDGVNFTGVGYDGPGDFDVAIRFEPSQLGDYDGTMLTEVSFFPSEAQCEYSIRVWTGANAANMVVDQLVADPVIGAWNTVTLDTPVEVDVSQELWFGYRNNAQAGFPAGADAGPAVVGYGDMIYDAATGWLSMATEYGLDYNWNIQGYVTSETDQVMALTPIEDQDRKANAGSPEATAPVVQTEESVFTPANRAFVGYNVYREDNFSGEWMQINEDLVTETTYTDELTTGGDYCYYIESIFEGCTSAPSNIECIQSYVGIGDVDADGLTVYPNPASDLINVSSTQTIERVTVLNYVGQVVKNLRVTDATEVKIGTENIEDGMYFIKIETNEGIVTKKVTIAR